MSINLGSEVPHLPVISALLVSPFESDHIVLHDLFEHTGWQLESARTVQEAMAALKRRAIPVVITECNFRDGDYKTLIEHSADLPNPPRVIVASRVADERLWADVLHLGGYAVLDTPFKARDAFHPIFLAWHSWQREVKASALKRRPARTTESIGRVASSAV
jgi:DNA-binding NtrC family response regulator